MAKVNELTVRRELDRILKEKIRHFHENEKPESESQIVKAKKRAELQFNKYGVNK